MQNEINLQITFIDFRFRLFARAALRYYWHSCQSPLPEVLKLRESKRLLTCIGDRENYDARL